MTRRDTPTAFKALFFLHRSSGAEFPDGALPEYLCPMPCVRHLSALMVGAALLSSAAAQTDSTSAQETWWKGLFRPDETATSPLPSDGTPNAQYDTKTLINNALDTAAFMNVPPERSLSDVTRLPATWTWTMPDTLRTLDSLDKADPKPLQGTASKSILVTCRKPEPFGPHSVGTIPARPAN